MYQDTDFGLETAEAVKDQLKEMNMELVAETTHKADETNFVGAINKLRDAKCDVVMLGTIITDTIIAVSTARKMGWDVDMVGQYCRLQLCHSTERRSRRRRVIRCHFNPDYV